MAISPLFIRNILGGLVLVSALVVLGCSAWEHHEASKAGLDTDGLVKFAFATSIISAFWESSQFVYRLRAATSLVFVDAIGTSIVFTLWLILASVITHQTRPLRDVCHYKKELISIGKEFAGDEWIPDIEHAFKKGCRMLNTNVGFQWIASIFSLAILALAIYTRVKSGPRATWAAKDRPLPGDYVMYNDPQTHAATSDDKVEV